MADPRIGPVQEKETIQSVSAIKNVPITPPNCSALLTRFARDGGKVISNAPKKDMAKKTKTTKKKMFNAGLVEISLSMLGLSPSIR